MVEGDTEILFYKRVRDRYFKNAKCKIKNLKGNYNINMKVLDWTSTHLNDNKKIEFCLCICIDKESRSDQAPIDMELIKDELRNFSNIKAENIELYEAIQDIESWFFHDIDGIFKFLKFKQNKLTKNARRKYKPVEKLNHQDLSKLFMQAGKEYIKGDSSEYFINSLDIEVVRKNSEVLDNFCTFMENIYNL